MLVLWLEWVVFGHFVIVVVVVATFTLVALLPMDIVLPIRLLVPPPSPAAALVFAKEATATRVAPSTVIV